jgi:hypothetical protein
MTFIKHRHGPLLSVVLIGSWTLACQSASDVPGREEFAKRFIAEVARASQTGSVELDVSALTPFDWDQMHAFPAISWPDGVSKKLGFVWGGGIHSESTKDDRYVLLVFTKARKVVMWLDFPRQVAGFYPLFGQGPVERSRSKLTLHRTGDYVALTKDGANLPEIRFKRYRDNGRTTEEIGREQLNMEAKSPGHRQVRR